MDKRRVTAAGAGLAVGAGMWFGTYEALSHLGGEQSTADVMSCAKQLGAVSLNSQAFFQACEQYKHDADVKRKVITLPQPTDTAINSTSEQITYSFPSRQKFLQDHYDGARTSDIREGDRVLAEASLTAAFGFAFGYLIMSTQEKATTEQLAAS